MKNRREYFAAWREANREHLRIYMRKWLRKHPNKNKELGRKWRKENPVISRAITKRWRDENPEKYRAHNALNNAIRDGKCSPKPCQVCGGNAQAHHQDYSKPLEVQWLCALHHKEKHQINNILPDESPF